MDKNTKQQLLEFFEKTIEKESFTLQVRRFMALGMRLYIYNDDNQNPVEKEWIIEGHFWLNELCEILDPYLEKDL